MIRFTLILSLFGLLASPSLLAESSVKLDGVHLCCKACVRGVDNALAKVDGATASCDQDAGTVVITAPDKKALRKGVNAMVRGGYYGTSNDASIKVKDFSGAKNKNVKSLTVTGLHLCCNGCVDSLEDALATVEGVSGNTAERKVESFKVMGDFNAKELFAALNNAGFAGKVGK